MIKSESSIYELSARENNNNNKTYLCSNYYTESTVHTFGELEKQSQKGLYFLKEAFKKMLKTCS